jgi:hypothetical protein
MEGDVEESKTRGHRRKLQSESSRDVPSLCDLMFPFSSVGSPRGQNLSKVALSITCDQVNFFLSIVHRKEEGSMSEFLLS